MCWVVGTEARRIRVNKKVPHCPTPTPPPWLPRDRPCGVNLPASCLSLLLRDLGEELPEVQAKIMSPPVPFSDTRLAGISWFRDNQSKTQFTLLRRLPWGRSYDNLLRAER